jgi:hypothetical protein
MKCKVTKKSIRENYPTIIKIGYCDAQYLLRDKVPFAYSERIEGWACDYYDCGNGICISTGYSPIGNVSNYEIVHQFNDCARLNYEHGKIWFYHMFEAFIQRMTE